MKKFTVILIVAALIISLFLLKPVQRNLNQQLQQQLNELDNLNIFLSQYADESGFTEVPVACQGLFFQRTLKVGSSGQDVQCLHVLLRNKLNSEFSKKLEGDYFNKTTKRAVAAFQRKQSTSSPQSVSVAGVVGTTTGRKLNEVMGKSDWNWVLSQNKLHTLSEQQVTSVLEKINQRFSKKMERMKALALLQVGTPYQRGCLGENKGRDKDSLFRLDVVDCTTLLLTNAAMVHAESYIEAEQNIVKANYRSEEVSFENRFHFTVDRIRNSSYFYPLTELMAIPSEIEKHQVVLNKTSDGERLININWEKEITLRFIPSENVDKQLVSSLPESCGVAFVDKSMFKKGLDVVHEGILINRQFLIHADSVQGEVVKRNFLNWYFKQGQPKYDGMILFGIN